jgi:uncharacterized membrane protein YcaP (DUF421 family)
VPIAGSPAFNTSAAYFLEKPQPTPVNYFRNSPIECIFTEPTIGMHDIIFWINDFVGKDIQDATLWQISVRAIVTYLFTIFLVRVGDKRFLGQNTAFDAVLGFILGSVVSRGINGSAPFVHTLVAASWLVLLHYLFSLLIYHSGDAVGALFEGHSIVLVRDGRIDRKSMEKHHITMKDLEGSIRQWGNIDSLDEVKLVTLERTGKISCVLRRELNLTSRTAAGSAT